jgi:hypothetical protein
MPKCLDGSCLDYLLSYGEKPITALSGKAKNNTTNNYHESSKLNNGRSICENTLEMMSLELRSLIE